MHRQAEELAPIALTGPSLGGLSHSYTSWMRPIAFSPVNSEQTSQGSMPTRTRKIVEAG
jgi:hypothetical protein